MSEQEQKEREEYQQRLKTRRRERAQKLQEQVTRMKQLNEENQDIKQNTTKFEAQDKPEQAKDSMEIEIDESQPSSLGSSTDRITEVKVDVQKLSIKSLKKMCKSLGLEEQSKLALEKSDLLSIVESNLSYDQISKLGVVALKRRVQKLCCTSPNTASQKELAEIVYNTTCKIVNELETA